MLLRFVLENHDSFREATELSFLATARKDEPAWKFISPHAPQGILPAVGVWGANASGKSNLLRGLLFLRRAVEESYTLRPTDAAPWRPWRLDRSEHAPPTRMELDFILSGVRYHFGFRLNSQGFIEEWLYQWEGRRRAVLYHRDRSQTPVWHFGAALKGPRTRHAEDTRENCLFLSVAAQNNHEQLLRVYAAIVEGIRREGVIHLAGYPLFHPDCPMLAPENRPALLGLLAAADVGVTDVRLEEVQQEALPPKAEAIFQPEFLDQLRREQLPGPLVRLVLGHGAPGDPWELPPDRESRGTQILLARLNDIFAALRLGHTLVVDEIDTSLHPDLCAAIVDLFTHPATNPHGAQILFATHDRDLLEHLRTDEVVLVDKDRSGASTLRTASDYRGLRTRDDLRRAHQQGRLRGVPVLGDLAGPLAVRAD